MSVSICVGMPVTALLVGFWGRTSSRPVSGHAIEVTWKPRGSWTAYAPHGLGNGEGAGTVRLRRLRNPLADCRCAAGIHMLPTKPTELGLWGGGIRGGLRRQVGRMLSRGP